MLTKYHIMRNKKRGIRPSFLCVKAQQSISDYYFFSNFHQRITVHQQYANSTSIVRNPSTNSTQFVHNSSIFVPCRPFVVVSLDPLSQSAATVAIVRPTTNSDVSCKKLLRRSYNMGYDRSYDVDKTGATTERDLRQVPLVMKLLRGLRRSWTQRAAPGKIFQKSRILSAGHSTQKMSQFEKI